MVFVLSLAAPYRPETEMRGRVTRPVVALFFVIRVERSEAHKY